MTGQYQYDRMYELVLGDYKTGKGIKITDLQLTFDISKSVDNTKKANSASIEVYNLSPQSLKMLETDFLACSFSVGYRGLPEADGTRKPIDLKRLVTGNVVEFKTAKQGTDIVTQIIMGEGYTDLNHKYLTQTIPRGKTLKDVLEEIRKQMPGVERGVFTGTNINNQVIHGYPLTGTPRQMLNEIARTYRIEWRVDNKALYVNDASGVIYKGNASAYVLNEKSGLIDIPYYTSLEGKKEKSDKTKRDGIQFTALLNPEIKPGEIIRVESKNVTGYYRVVDARYTGDYRGQFWYVEGTASILKQEDYSQ